jgi:hypothetical protein
MSPLFLTMVVGQRRGDGYEDQDSWDLGWKDLGCVLNGKVSRTCVQALQT